MPDKFVPSVLRGKGTSGRVGAAPVKDISDTYVPSVLRGKDKKKDEDDWGLPPPVIPKSDSPGIVRSVVDIVFNRLPSAMAGAGYESALARKGGMSQWDPRIVAPMYEGFKRGITGEERYRFGDYLGEMGMKEGIPRQMADEVFHFVASPGGLGALKLGGMAVKSGLKAAGRQVATKPGLGKAAQTAAGVGLGGGAYEGLSAYGEGADIPDALKAGAAGTAMWGAAELGLGMAGMPVKALFPGATEAVAKGIGGGVLGTGFGTAMGVAQGQDIGEAFVRSGIPVGGMFGAMGAVSGRYDPLPKGKIAPKQRSSSLDYLAGEGAAKADKPQTIYVTPEGHAKATPREILRLPEGKSGKTYNIRGQIDDLHVPRSDIGTAEWPDLRVTSNYYVDSLGRASRVAPGHELPGRVFPALAEGELGRNLPTVIDPTPFHLQRPALMPATRWEPGTGYPIEGRWFATPGGHVKGTPGEVPMLPEGRVRDTRYNMHALMDEGPMPDSSILNRGLPKNDIPMSDRTFSNVGRQDVNAYHSDYTELAPHVQAEARHLLEEFYTGTKGMRIPVYHESAYFDINAPTVLGFKRSASESIARILDETGATYDAVRNALEGIAQGDARRNSALAKRIELVIDDNLTYGRKDYLSGADIPPNEAYILAKSRFDKGAKVDHIKPQREIADAEYEIIFDSWTKERYKLGEVSEGDIAALRQIVAERGGTKLAEGIEFAPEALKRSDFKAVSEIADALGLKVVPFKGKGLRGMVQGRTIYLNEGIKDPLDYVFWHEVAHTMEATHPEHYAKLMQIAREHVADTGGLAKHYKKFGYAEGDIPHEFTADTFAEVLTEKGFFAKVADSAPELLRPLLNAVDALIARVKSMVSRSDTVKPYIKNLDALRERVRKEVAEPYFKDAVDEKRFVDRFGDQWAEPAAAKAKGVADQTNTPEFRRWFGDSKVVDADGRPLRVYHGSPFKFNEFDYGRIGTIGRDDAGEAFFFTSDKTTADIYSDPTFLRDYDFASMEVPKDAFDIPVEPTVYETYLSIRNPLEVNKGGKKMTFGAEYDADTQLGWVEKARDSGKDGVIIYNASDAGELGSGNIYIVFEPTQIKSVHNRGTFDPTNPDIRFKTERQSIVDEVKSMVEYGAEHLHKGGYAHFEKLLGREFADTLGRYSPEIAERLTQDVWHMARDLRNTGRTEINMGGEVTPIVRSTTKGQARVAADSETQEAGGWLRDKVAQFRKKDPEYVTELKGAVLEADRLHRAKVATTGVRTSRWKETLSESQLEDIGAAVEGIGNLRTGKSADAIRTEMGKDPKMIRVRDEYKASMEQMRQDINKYLKGLTEGDYLNLVKDYIPHFYLKPGVLREKELVRKIARWQQNSPNAKARKLPTLKEAVEMGLVPLTQNVAELQAKYADLNWRVATNRRLLETANKMVNEEGMPIIMKDKDAPADWIRKEHPAFAKIYARRGPDGKTVLYEGKAAIDPQAYPVLRQLIEEPIGGRLMGALEGFNAYAKKAQLSLSLFHHWALTESAMATLGRKGLFLVGKETKGIGRFGITQPHRVGKKLMSQEGFIEDAVSHGLVLDSVKDAQVGRVKTGLVNLEKRLANVPGMGKVARAIRKANDAWDQTLWGNYHSGLKAYTYYDMVGRYARRLPENASAKDVRVMKEKVAEIINDMYGGQEWVSKWWLSPKGQQAWQALQLAPDWSLSNFSIAAKAFTKAKDPVIGPATRRYWRNMLLSQVMVIAGANYALGGRWPWENEAGHKTEIDVTDAVRVIDKAMGRKDKNPDQRYYMHPGKQVREVLGWLEDPWATIRRKASPAVHTVMEQTTGHTTTGWEMPWTEDGVEKSFWVSLPDRTKATAEKFVPFSVGGVGAKTQFAFTFPMRKGMTPWKAHKAYQDVIKMEMDPNFAQKTYRKAFQGIAEDFTGQPLKDRLDDACLLNGLDPEKMYKDARTKVTSEYYALMWDAINRDNMKDADKAAKVLLKLGVTPKRLKSSGESRGLGEEEYAQAADAMRRMHGRQ